MSRVLALVLLFAVTATLAVVAGEPVAVADDDVVASMAVGNGNWAVEPIWTVGESIDGYTPPGLIDGLGAYELDGNTVRVFANHELRQGRAYRYTVSNGFSLKGARISYFDIDKTTKEVVGSGLAYDSIYDVNGELATDLSFLPTGRRGFARFCSGTMFEPRLFDGSRGFEDRLYLVGEEDGGAIIPGIGAFWAIDPATNDIWHLPDLGRGAWENAALVDTGDANTVGLILTDDSRPLDFDGDGEPEAPPLFLYLGEKDPAGDFPARNGLRGGTLHVWVAGSGVTSPAEFNTTGRVWGRWIPIDNSPTGPPSDDGSTGYGKFGYPTQPNLWLQAKAVGAFGFARLEDVATNPTNGEQFAFAATGETSYAGGADSVGTVYTMRLNLRTKLAGTLKIAYDGDADPQRRLRSPDNLDWADNNRIFVQEDKAEDVTVFGETLFGPGAANHREAGMVRMKPDGGGIVRVMNVDRSVLVDPTTTGTAVDRSADVAGAWETSGVVDVSRLFGEQGGTLLLMTVQPHGVNNQQEFNADSRLANNDLREAGQLSFLYLTTKVDLD